MYHVELRHFPNVARVFNLTREELDARILRAWTAGRPVLVDDRRWSPDRARLTIVEGPRLETDELGQGRGWGNATRSGEDVTARVLEELAESGPHARGVVEALKAEVVSRATDAAVPVATAFEVASERHEGWRVSDRLALAETAVWELLHQGRLRMLRGDGSDVDRDDWERVLLAWETWSGADADVGWWLRASRAPGANG